MKYNLHKITKWVSDRMKYSVLILCDAFLFLECCLGAYFQLAFVSITTVKERVFFYQDET